MTAPIETSTSTVKRLVTASLSGLLFAVGLCIAGMTQPSKIIGFLDFTGDWDPSLACVMAGAIAVYASVWRWARKADAPLFASGFKVPARRSIDRSLVIGSAIFGVGWGLAGYCPGPALTATATSMVHAGPLVFVVGMTAGVLLLNGFKRRASPSTRR